MLKKIANEVNKFINAEYQKILKNIGWLFFDRIFRMGMGLVVAASALVLGLGAHAEVLAPVGLRRAVAEAAAAILARADQDDEPRILPR